MPAIFPSSNSLNPTTFCLYLSLMCRTNRQVSIFSNFSYVIIRNRAVAIFLKASIISMRSENFDKLTSAEKEWILRIYNSRIICRHFSRH